MGKFGPPGARFGMVPGGLAQMPNQTTWFGSALKNPQTKPETRFGSRFGAVPFGS